MTITIHSVGAGDWARLKDIRLRMLADTPIAYGETLARARTLTDDEWVERARRGERPHSTSLAAVADDANWVGIMNGVVSGVRGPMLVGVFVDPRARGRHAGIADALLDGVVAWARGEGESLTLDVHADNPRAIAFYRRRGFVETGATQAYTLPPYGIENEMRLDLRAG